MKSTRLATLPPAILSAFLAVQKQHPAAAGKPMLDGSCRVEMAWPLGGVAVVYFSPAKDADGLWMSPREPFQAGEKRFACGPEAGRAWCELFDRAVKEAQGRRRGE